MPFTISFCRLCAVMFFLLLNSLSLAAVETKKPKVLIQTIVPALSSKKLLFPARVDSKTVSTVTADFDAYLKKIVRPLGTRVRAGDTVLMMENQDPAFTYASVPVRSLINGVVSQLNLPLMSKVAKGDRLFTIVGADSLRLIIEVPTYDVRDINVNSIGTFKYSPKDESGFEVKVSGISPVADPRLGTASAELEFTKKVNKDAQVPSLGSVGQVSFSVSKGEVIEIPLNALTYLDGKPTVRLLNSKNEARRTEVNLGDQQNDMVVIKSGIKKGDRIVIRSSERISDGQVVEIESGADKK